MITILGAGGVISNELLKLLVVLKQPIRLVGRHPNSVPGTHEVLSADLSDKEQPYLFDSSKFAKAFGISGTSYAVGIGATAASFKESL